MLKYREDSRSITVVILYFVFATFLWFYPERDWIWLSFLAATFTVSFLGAVIAHNSLHCPIFIKNWMNRVFQVGLTLTYGFPVSEYVPGHNLSHHLFVQQRKDVMRTSKVRFQWGILNILTFFPAVAVGITRTNYRYVSTMKEKNRRWYRQLKLEMATTWSVKAVLLAIDWRKALVIIVLPHVLAVWGITTINFFQHDGCNPQSKYNHSRNFVGRLFNFIMFNNGFHGIHHMYPELHWSKLPEAHARLLKPYIDPRLDRNFFEYLFKMLFSKRINFDGTPVVLENDQVDEDWIYPSQNAEIQLVG